MKIVLVTGGFDPLHSGHIAYFNEAKKLGDILVVGLNSDNWLVRKKGQSFMNIKERLDMISNLSMINSTMFFNDDDGSAADAIQYCLDKYPNDTIIFANGGDRTSSNIPEMFAITNPRVQWVFSVGGFDKINSSSKILSDWKTPKTEKDWGYYRVLHSDGPSTKVKELVVKPNHSLSLQRHKYRNEYWIVSCGIATIRFGSDVNKLETKTLTKHQEIRIPETYWHQLINTTENDLRIVEIQYGESCIEEDIERKANAIFV